MLKYEHSQRMEVDPDMEKTIIEKLNLTKYNHKVILNKPESHYFSDLTEVEEAFPTAPVDLIIAFVTTVEEFQKIVQQVIEEKILMDNGLLYVAYPKKGNSKYQTFVHRDEIFPALKIDKEDGYIKGTTFKFNRMVRLDEVFTIAGIKNTKKKAASTKKSSQSVNDYAHLIPQLKVMLSSNQKAKTFFCELTPGYQKDWARYIYSAKQEETQEKRRLETIDILAKGFKSRTLYQQFKREERGK